LIDLLEIYLNLSLMNLFFILVLELKSEKVGFHKSGFDF